VAKVVSGLMRLAHSISRVDRNFFHPKSGFLEMWNGNIVFFFFFFFLEIVGGNEYDSYIWDLASVH
jgi:hypothetical protein